MCRCANGWELTNRSAAIIVRNFFVVRALANGRPIAALAFSNFRNLRAAKNQKTQKFVRKIHAMKNPKTSQRESFGSACRLPATVPTRTYQPSVTGRLYMRTLAF
jgi:hypothetical protein